MKDHLAFFVVYTLLEMIFSTAYWMLTKQINNTLLVGAILYALAMYCGYRSYCAFRYRQSRRALIDALP